MSVLILVVDDEPDVADLFRQQFRRELRSDRFTMAFAQSAAEALERVSASDGTSLILVFSDINMPGMSGLELLPLVRRARPVIVYLRDLEAVARRECDSREAIQVIASGRHILGDYEEIDPVDGPFSRT